MLGGADQQDALEHSQNRKANVRTRKRWEPLRLRCLGEYLQQNFADFLRVELP